MTPAKHLPTQNAQPPALVGQRVGALGALHTTGHVVQVCFILLT
jgi:hypothetical protein